MIDTAPRDVRNMKKTIDTTQVDEYTEIGHVLDHTFQYLTLLQVVQDFCFLLFEILLDQYFVRNNYVIVGVVDFNNLHFHFLAYINIEIPDRLHVNLRAW